MTGYKMLHKADAYSMYVKRKIAQMDYNNGIRAAREEEKKELR
jgi:hypothetical protein